MFKMKRETEIDIENRDQIHGRETERGRGRQR